MHLLAILLAVVVAPPVIDSIFRLVLAAASRRRSHEEPGDRPNCWSVVVPARSEGAHVEKTLASIDAAKAGNDVRTILLLDGDDAAAERIGRQFGAITLVKNPPGPTKGAALGWLARTPPAALQQADAVLILDVGSTLSPQFFYAFRWSPGADAVQVFLRGSGTGVGEAAAHSEAVAQAREDVGRQRLGWSVRLRGTGTVLRRRVFTVAAPLLVTQVEDTELTLLLAADGKRCAISDSDAFVIDDKPGGKGAAAAQRSRWLAGRAEVLIRRWRLLARLVARRPLEGIAFVAELFGRPLSLTVPLRAVLGAALVGIGVSRSVTWAAIAGAIALLSAASDVALHARGGALASSGSMFVSWLVALVLAPRALVRWVRTKRS